MIVFDNWVIRPEKRILLRQFDDCVTTLKVTGTLPEGWEWVMLVRNGKNMDLLPLAVMGDGIGIVLTRECLALAGTYWLQLRGKKGGQVRHTNQIFMKVDGSLSGDVQWPELPRVFTELEERLDRKVHLAEEHALHTPVIGENGNWWTWDCGVYTDTGKPCRGESGPAYQLTDHDKRELADVILASLPVYNGEVEEV